MGDGLKTLAEQRIEAAAQSGELEGLAGEGKPLPRRDETMDVMTEVGHKIMSDAGALPREVLVKRELAAARAAYAAATDDTSRKAAMSRIAKAELAHNMAFEARGRTTGR